MLALRIAAKSSYDAREITSLRLSKRQGRDTEPGHSVHGSGSFDFIPMSSGKFAPPRGNVEKTKAAHETGRSAAAKP